jgi:hypothetical protein
MPSLCGPAAVDPHPKDEVVAVAWAADGTLVSAHANGGARRGRQGMRRHALEQAGRQPGRRARAGAAAQRVSITSVPTSGCRRPQGTSSRGGGRRTRTARRHEPAAPVDHPLITPPGFGLALCLLAAICSLSRAPVMRSGRRGRTGGRATLLHTRRARPAAVRARRRAGTWVLYPLSCLPPGFHGIRFLPYATCASAPRSPQRTRAQRSRDGLTSRARAVRRFPRRR